MRHDELKSLHGIDEPLRFIRRALDDEMRSRGAHLDEDRYADCVGYLSLVLVRLAKRYDPTRGPSFSTYAYGILRRRYTSFLRENRGDSRYGNDGREQSVADPDELREALASEDDLDFAALVEQMDHDRLSSRAKGTLYELARPIAEEGISVTEAGARVGKSRREAGRDLDRLRMELTG